MTGIEGEEVVNGEKHYMVQWASTLEPAAHVPTEMVEAFRLKVRSQVEKTYIEKEAEDRAHKDDSDDATA